MLFLVYFFINFGFFRFINGIKIFLFMNLLIVVMLKKICGCVIMKVLKFDVYSNVISFS